MYFFSLREIRIRTATGSHDQIIPARKADFVLPLLHEAAIAAGCVPCDKDGKLLDGEAILPVISPNPVSRTAEVEAAVEQVISVGNPSDFNAVTGKPKVAAVSKIVGSKITAVELDEAFNAVTARNVVDESSDDGLESDA